VLTGSLLAIALAAPAAWGQQGERGERGRFANAFDQTVWQQRDANNDGKLTWREYVQDTTDVREVVIRKRLFTRADENGDGEVTRQEAAQFGQGRPQPGDRDDAEQSIELSDQEASALEQAFNQQNFEQWDRNNDKSLSMGEFISASARPGDVDERRRLFQLVDIDNNNMVTRFEVQQVLQSGIGRTIMLPIVVDVFNLRDQNNDRDLSREEFLSGLSGAALAAAERGFKVIDRNNSGTISPRELDSFLMGRPGQQSQGADVLATPRTDEPAVIEKPAAPTVRGSDALRQGWLNSFNAYDHNKDGALDVNELADHYRGAQAQQARQTFYADDLNFDGKLTQQELRAGLQRGAGNE
jgi:Ca2+-binding EF-hand superfamily protein